MPLFPLDGCARARGASEHEVEAIFKVEKKTGEEEKAFSFSLFFCSCLVREERGERKNSPSLKKKEKRFFYSREINAMQRSSCSRRPSSKGASARTTMSTVASTTRLRSSRSSSVKASAEADAKKNVDAKKKVTRKLRCDMLWKDFPCLFFQCFQA